MTIIGILLQAEALDEVSLKKLLLQFEKRLCRNQELRIKFPDMPEKYVANVIIECFYFRAPDISWCHCCLFHFVLIRN